MLKLFEVTGFKNFEEKITMDFTDVRDYRFNPECISRGLVSKAIIYGKNAIGKSNFGLALFDIVTHLSDKHVGPSLYDYYLNVNNKNDHASFRYVFDFDGNEVEYSYRKDFKHKLIYDSVKINDKLLYNFDYVSKEGDKSGINEFAPTLNWAFSETECILKYVINNTVIDDSHPLRKMMCFVNNMLWFRSLDENRYIGYKTKSDDYFDFVFEESVLKEFEALLNASGIDDGLKVIVDNDGRKRLYFDTETPLPFFPVASNGTKALYSFFYWYKTAKDVSFMFVDEFDAFYHFELAESIVSILEKMSDTQVILTSHNTNLLTNRIMRPDCYFIMTKNKLTSLANATDRELREGHNLEKLYMSGEFNG